MCAGLDAGVAKALARQVGGRRVFAQRAATGGKGSQIAAIIGFFEDFWSLGWVEMTHMRGVTARLAAAKEFQQEHAEKTEKEKLNPPSLR